MGQRKELLLNADGTVPDNYLAALDQIRAAEGSKAAESFAYRFGYNEHVHTPGLLGPNSPVAWTRIFEQTAEQRGWAIDWHGLKGSDG